MGVTTSITRINLEGFGCFQESRFFVFEPQGLTLILGDNERGKSTLIAAIKAILFGLKPEFIQKRIPWNSSCNFSGELFLTQRLASGRSVEYCIKRSFENNQTIVQDLSTGDESAVLFNNRANPNARGKNRQLALYHQILSKLIGFTEEIYFNQTVCIEQQQVETTITDQLRHAVSGFQGQDYDAVIAQLEAEYFLLTKERYNENSSYRNKPMKLERLETELYAKKQQLVKAQQNQQRIQSTRTALEQQQKELCAIEQQHLQAVEQFTLYKTFHDLHTDIAERSEVLHTIQQQFEDIEKKAQERDALQYKLEEMGYCQKPDQVLLETLLKLQQATSDLDAAEQQKQQVQKTDEKHLSLVIVIGSILIAAGIIAAIMFHKITFVVIGFLIAAVTSIPWLLKKQNALQNIREIQENLHSTISKKQQQREELISCITSYRKSTDHAVDAETEKQRYNHYLELQKQHDVLQEVLQKLPAIEMLKSEKTKHEKELIPKTLQRDEMLQQHQFLKAFEQHQQPFIFIQTLERDTQKLQQEKDKLQQTVTQFEIDLNIMQNQQMHNPQMLKEEIAELEQEHANKFEHSQALKLALNTLQDAIVEFNQNDKLILAQQMSNFFKTCTSNRYQSLTLDDAYIPEISLTGQEPIAADQLSQGTQDQLFFALRLAFSSMYCNGIACPLLLDDPFINYDDKRLENVMEMLNEISRDRQIIIASHDKRLQTYLPEIIQL